MIKESLAYKSLEKIKHFVLDMDGTIYEGGTLYDTTLPFLEKLKELGIGWTFLTNNSSRSIDSYLEHLQCMGLKICPENLYTSTLFAVDYIKEKMPGCEKLFVLGTDSMREEITYHGFKDVYNEPDAVLLGFDTDLNYRRLCKAGYWIMQGKPFITTHPDPLCPTDEKILFIDCGCVTACLEKGTGRKATVLGKPNPELLYKVARKNGVGIENIAMVGDRLNTDIKMAADAGALSVHISKDKESEIYPEKSVHPDFSVRHLGELASLFD